MREALFEEEEDAFFFVFFSRSVEKQAFLFSVL